MTKKHYIQFANAFANSRPHLSKRSTKEQRASMTTWIETRNEIMKVLAANNPNFDYQRFIKATEQ